MRLRDKHGRYITDLRVSITDRCNYRCVYCRTGNQGAQYSELPLSDYLRMVRIMVGLGIEKVRLTGGEPLLRSGVVDFVRDVAMLRSLDGHKLDIAITTNGHLLADMVEPLKRAGLRRATVSMDAVDPEKFARITRVPKGYDAVLAGIRAARRAGLDPVKVNCVLLRGFNEDQIVEFARFSREEGVVVRFIEFMPLSSSCRWKKTAYGRPRLWSPWTRSWRSSTSSVPYASCPTPPARRRAATPSMTARAKLELSRRFRILFAGTVRASA